MERWILSHAFYHISMHSEWKDCQIGASAQEMQTWKWSFAFGLHINIHQPSMSCVGDRWSVNDKWPFGKLDFYYCENGCLDLIWFECLGRIHYSNAFCRLWLRPFTIPRIVQRTHELWFCDVCLLLANNNNNRRLSSSIFSIHHTFINGNNNAHSMYARTRAPFSNSKNTRPSIVRSHQTLEMMMNKRERESKKKTNHWNVEY